MRKSSFTAIQISKCALCTAIISICSWIQIPSPVPFTLQTLGIFLTLGLLGGKLGTLSILSYILLGIVGVPVFSGFQGGINAVMGATGGYIVGFIFSGLIFRLIETFCSKNNLSLIVSMLIGLLVCYISGTLWFMLVYSNQNGSIGIWQTLCWCVIPFIIPDILKIFCVSAIVKKIKKHNV